MKKPRIRSERSDIGRAHQDFPELLIGVISEETFNSMPANRRWELKNVEKDKAIRKEQHYINNLKKKFGMTHEDYQEMFYEQNGLCAICGNPETATRAGETLRLAVDHDHKTGKIRGLLCLRCNNMLGLAVENREILKSAIIYLDRYI